MRKVNLMMLLAVVSSCAEAGWVKISAIETGTSYIDTATIKRVGSKVKMWDLSDFNTVKMPNTDKPFKSMKSQVEYDCKKEQTRTIYISSHSGNMGGGEATIFGNGLTSSEWELVPPGSLSRTLWEFACKKR